MRAFRQVALAFGSVLFISGFALGQARLGPYVIDSNGLKVGHARDTGSILMFINGIPTVIIAGSSGFAAEEFVLFFTDDACGTQALLMEGASANEFVEPGFYTTDGMVHYLDPAALANTAPHSAIPVSTDGSMGACESAGGTGFAAPALTASVSGFTPPFSVVDTLPVSPAPATATFNDVPTTHPFFRYVEALYNSGITGGCSAAPPLYCPDNPVTRGQVAVFIAKALGL
jgi:S-layer family protein